MAEAVLETRVPSANGAFYRRVLIGPSGTTGSFFVQVGKPTQHGIEFLDDLKVAKAVIEALTERGWRVVPEKHRSSALFKAEESAVMSRKFKVERI